jgi:hypothetical protein
MRQGWVKVVGSNPAGPTKQGFFQTDNFKNPNSLFYFDGDFDVSKKGETGEQDRGKPQPQKKKDRDAKRKDKKSARLERQKSR